MSKSIPKFKDEDAEREFWSKHDSSEYLNWKNAERVLFPNLKPSTKSISLRLPESLLDALRQMANERDVPYQSLIKMILQERIERELRSRHLPKGG
jgi:predicted DNA binding CopG/RHH family protein